MEFGRVPEEGLNNVDFSLPKEPAFNKKILAGRKTKTPKYILAAQSGEERNGLEKFILKKRKKKIFCNIMYNTITA